MVKPAMARLKSPIALTLSTTAWGRPRQVTISTSTVRMTTRPVRMTSRQSNHERDALAIGNTTCPT